ncbi:hypothetical protein BV20DRAFT_416286 [Pilatotrama ljubarskyi]|nr:hypothetical protein BV20DRAFT_416286 [Pilatotrama ljubarskyi]
MDAQSHGFSHVAPQRRPTASTALWGHLLRKTGSSQVPPSSATSTSTFGKHAPAVAPIDKAGASTRILLHDTQAHLEKFTDRVTQLTTGLEDAKRELVTVQKLYQDEHEHVLDSITGLTNRCQTELQKTIGSPAQRTEIREMSKDLSHLSIRLDSLDKKIDSLSMLTQTQSQALQTIQDQQGQLLAALTPILPLIQAVPLHIESARDRVKDAVSDLRKDILCVDSASRFARAGGRGSQLSRHSQNHSSSPHDFGVSALTPPKRKRRRLETVSDGVEGGPTATSAGISGTSLDRMDVAAVPLLVGSGSASLQSRTTPSPAIGSGSDLRTPRRTPLADLHGYHSHITTPSVPLRKVSAGLDSGPLLGRASSQSQSAADLLAPSATPDDHSVRSLSGQPHARNMRPAAPTGASPNLAGSHNSFAGYTRRTPQPHHVATASVARPPSSTRKGPIGQMNHLSSASLASRDPAVSLQMKHESLVALKQSSRTLQTPEIAARHGQLVANPPATPSLDSIPVTGGACMPPPSTGKPMSLKDRRALLAEDVQRNEGKRFIPLDDEEEEELELMP